MYVINASSIGNLLGIFGPSSQYKAFLSVWSKNKSKYPGFLNSNSLNGWLHRQDFLVRNRLAKTFENFENHAQSCEYTETVAETCAGIYKMIFNPDNFESALASTRLTEEQKKKLLTLLCDNNLDMENINLETVDLFPSPLYEELDLARQLFAHFRTKINMTYGKIGEKKYIELYNMRGQDDIVFQQQNGEIAKKTPSGVVYRITGNIDGKYPDGTILEIKHRQKQIFRRLPVYELIQLHAYMCMHEKTCIEIVQCLSSRELGYWTEKTVVHFDGQFWNTVTSELDRVIMFMEQFADNPMALELFSKLDAYERQCFVTSKLPMLKTEDTPN